MIILFILNVYPSTTESEYYNSYEITVQVLEIQEKKKIYYTMGVILQKVNTTSYHQVKGTPKGQARERSNIEN